MAQFEIITRQKEGVIEFNFEDLKRELTIAIEPYTSLVITEDMILEMKKVKAKLNTLQTQINKKRLEEERQFMIPFNVFKGQCKELMEIINPVVVNMDNQLKAFDEQKKAEKMEAITAFFIDQKFRTVSLDQLFDEKWLNATVSDKSWKEQLNGKIETIKAELALLDNFNVEDKELLKSFYLETLDMTGAKARYDAIQARKAKMIEVRVETPEIKENAPIASETATVTENEVLTRTFWVKGTREQIIALGNYMNSQNIEFGKVE